jgi:hypothetical protein
MKKIVAVLTLILVLVLILALSHLKTVRGENLGRLVLPNPKLLRCRSSNCRQLFSEGTEQKAISPKQMILDIDHGCIYGMTVMFEKSVPFDQLKTEIDDLYKQWSVNDPSNSTLHLWRVEPQKFAIQLAVTSKEDEKRNVAEAGTRQVIYIAFGGKSACRLP